MKPIGRRPAIAGLLALACAGGPPEVPASLQALMLREVQLPPAADVATADGAVHARVAGHLTGEFARAPGDESYFGMFSIGTQVPVACHVFDEEKDLVMFDGGGGTATLYKPSKIKGLKGQLIEGKKIFYQRATGQYWGDDIKSIEQ